MIAHSAQPTSIALRSHRVATALLAAACVAAAASGCHGSTPPPPEPQTSERGSGQVEGPTEAPATPSPAGEASDETVPPDGPFPSMGGEGGRFHVDHLETRYTRDIAGQGPLYAVLETSAGPIRCRLFEDKAPRTVDNFVGLARGLKPWRDPHTGETVTRPFFDGLLFHRVIPGLLVQTGDPTATGNGHPGYFFEDEFGEGLSHNQAGVMSMAQSRPDGNGSQFFITDGPAPQFDGRYPIFGLCADTEVVHTIATRDVGDSRTHRPKEPVVLQSVRFERGT